ncbi:heterokaryon incompatibility protein-domain-containing protein [Xylaria flabelliformis]|nr:heterokaryon incompatibility protein-domain-containing protein [Xylaria flabelliformis]
MDINTSTLAGPSNDDTGSQAAHGYKIPKPRPYYNYTTLPEGWIRLVRIHGNPINATSSSDLNDDLHVTLHDYPLSSCPDYIALSYTWGEPFGKVDPAYRVFTQEPRCFPINCGRYLLRGTRNLRAAIRQLRKGRQVGKNVEPLNQSCDYVEKLYQDSGSLMPINSYWIDALCIDQDDPFERSTQVSLMREIYKKARFCIVWLGETNQHVIGAMELSLELSHNRELSDAFKEIPNSSAVQQNFKFQEIFDNIIERLPREKIIALVVLLSHAWFSRVWVLQEVALATKVAVQCGSRSIDFENLMWLGVYMTTSKDVFSLTSMVTPDRQNLRILQAGNGLIGTHIMLSTLFRIKNELSVGTTPTFSRVSVLASECKSTDPRDKVYGLLALTSEFQQDSKYTLCPDYTLPVQAVYVKATSQIISRQKHLDFLLQVCQQHRKNITGLPSWCLDYTHLRTGLYSRDSIGEIGYAAPPWKSKPHIKIVDDKMLIVHGFCYDVVNKVTHGAKGLLDLGLSMRLSNQSRKNGITRIESLWRLLIQDELTVMPAPKVVGLYFPAMIGMLIHSTEYSPLSGKQVTVNLNLGDLLRIIDELRLLEPENSPFLPDTDLMREIFDEGGSRNMDVDHADIYTVQETLSVPQRAVEAGLIPELELLWGCGSDTSENGFDYQIMAIFRDNTMPSLSQILHDVSFLSTENPELLGTCNTSIKTGDQVWILNGSSVPILLRPLSNGNYEFLGATYVHGIMGDEDEVKPYKAQEVCIE